MRILVCTESAEDARLVFPAVQHLSRSTELDLHFLRVISEDDVEQADEAAGEYGISADPIRADPARGIADIASPGIPAPAADTTGRMMPPPAATLPPAGIASSGDPDVIAAADRDVRTEHASSDARADMASLAAEHSLDGRMQVVVGDPTTEILRIARDLNVDVVAMGSSLRSPVGEVIHGSVAKSVLRGSDVPVLVIRTGT